MKESVLTKNQVRTISKNITYNGHQRVMTVTLRYDDRCNNGHNTFSITGNISTLTRNTCIVSGCIHDEIREFFPELTKYIKWHLCSSNGPLHYIANTLYHASVKPEYLSDVWEAWIENTYIKKVNVSERAVLRVKYGKNIEFRCVKDPSAKSAELDAARYCAIWPEANLEDFTEENLLKRLPALIQEFARDMEELDFIF